MKTLSTSSLHIEFTVRNIILRAIDFRGDSYKHTIIALHGWLDNAESFRLLGPKLAEQGLRVIALDLAGQGLSDMRPLQGSYHLWDDAVDVIQIAEQLELSQYSLLGHSRGAMIATQIATAFPEKIKSLCVLDGLLPIPVNIDETVEQFRRFTLGFQSRRASRVFSRRQDAIEIRAKAARMDVDAVELLAERGLFKCEGENSEGWQWRVDERLKIASAVKMTEAHNQQWLEKLENTKMPVQIILAQQGLSQLPLFKTYQNQHSQWQWILLEGGHHQHMQAQASKLAEHVVGFFV